MKIAGIITAAGLSSRMGSFKPLLPLNGLPMALHTVLNMKSAGLDPICVVTGHRGGELRAALDCTEVIFANNELPGSSDMLCSIKLALEKIYDSDGFFLLPGDMPLVSPAVFNKVLENAVLTGSKYTIPTVNGKKAHPPLIMKDCYDAILNFNGSGGLPAALSGFSPSFVDAGDTVSNMDADFPEDFNTIQSYAYDRLGLSQEMCLALMDKAGTPDNVRAHCIAVGDLAGHMAGVLSSHGYCIDILRCRTAGMLHDIMRTEKNHAAVGAEFLEKEGFSQIADIVRHHMTFDSLGTDFDEYTVVCLADKLRSGTTRVSPFERYMPAFEKFPSGTDIGERIIRDCARAFSLHAKYVELTGECLY